MFCKFPLVLFLWLSSRLLDFLRTRICFQHTVSGHNFTATVSESLISFTAGLRESALVLVTLSMCHGFFEPLCVSLQASHFLLCTSLFFSCVPVGLYSTLVVCMGRLQLQCRRMMRADILDVHCVPGKRGLNRNKICGVWNNG